MRPPTQAASWVVKRTALSRQRRCRGWLQAFRGCFGAVPDIEDCRLPDGVGLVLQPGEECSPSMRRWRFWRSMASKRKTRAKTKSTRRTKMRKRKRKKRKRRRAKSTDKASLKSDWQLCRCDTNAVPKGRHSNEGPVQTFSPLCTDQKNRDDASKTPGFPNSLNDRQLPAGSRSGAGQRSCYMLPPETTSLSRLLR